MPQRKLALYAKRIVEYYDSRYGDQTGKLIITEDPELLSYSDIVPL